MVKDYTCVPKPLKVDFAELCGIHAGDGWMSSYGNEVGYGTSIKEIKYFKYVRNLYSKLFNFDIFRIVKRGYPYNSIELRIASKNMQNTLLLAGFPRGPKLNKLTVPKFIYKNKSYMKSFLRGLIDTDGTVHWRRYNNTYYLILTWNTKSKTFVYEIKNLLEKLGYSPHIYSTISRKTDSDRWVLWRVYLQRKGDIKKFIDTVGFSNITKTKQVLSKKKYLERYGLAQIRTGDIYRVRVASSTINGHSR